MSYSFGLFPFGWYIGFCLVSCAQPGRGANFWESAGDRDGETCFNSEFGVVWYSEGSLHDRVFGDVGHKVHEGALSYTS